MLWKRGGNDLREKKKKTTAFRIGAESLFFDLSAAA
jgi:hypothetical protein